MNRTLYRYEMKNSLRMLLIFAAVLTMYVVCIIWMFDPEMMERIKERFCIQMPATVRNRIPDIHP